jgi:arsenate reductase
MPALDFTRMRIALGRRRFMHSTWFRAVLLAVGIWTGDASLAQMPAAASGSDPHRIVFVCEHGSVKSLVAALYFNQRAQLRGLRYTAVARGTSPQANVPASVQLALRADGFDVDRYVPQAFSTTDLDKASLVVSFDQDTTNTVAGRVRELRWDNSPSVLADYVLGRDEILKRVDGLIEALMAAARERS